MGDRTDSTFGKRKIVAGIVCAGGLLLASCGRQAPSAPLSFIHADPSLSAPESTLSDELFTATLPKQASEDEYVSAAAVIVKHVTQAIQARAPDVPPGMTNVSFLFLRPDMDKFGNPGAHSFLSASYPVADLKAAHLDRIGAYGVLNLASDVQVMWPWQRAVEEWCGLHDSAPLFCDRARGSLSPEDKTQ